MPFKAKLDQPAEETAPWPSQERGSATGAVPLFHFWVVPLRTA